ncbi:MAG: undecaprenyl/decaprenyl-phosphate alpha-N-acetylglucosaminyl 1-phosphate transferase [Candidatus Andersenbacteria bacterium]|nr:undecaprenyl/decaprenyl-phosphate alpha-N-acetylglucosaminyl 1-phosphate transferase [Candidatus Andersenbacteria bacterium]MBI3250446.1 undecaprenyl/decaprenyl-phosphate alpha-N-acetylglucosaminyl 1-phosphate transferase [Candidatus Andersenbacteria bacterium]
MLPLDTTLFTASYGYVWLGIFVLLNFLISREIKSGRAYVGVLLTALVVAAAWFVIPEWGMRWGLLIASILVIIVGKSDEIMKLSARTQLIWQIVIAAIVVVSGWTIPYVSHPFADGLLNLTLFQVGPLTLPADLLAIAWIVLLMNAVNWLDGMDGLAGGVGVIAHIALVAVAMLPSIQSGTTLGLAGIGASALAAFFIWNAPPAKVYLGTVGSWFIGMYLAIVASGGGGKIATALLILAIPIVDVGVVVLRRIISGHSVTSGDTVNHIHHRWQKAGVSKRTILAAALVVTAFLGLASILLTTQAKLIFFVVSALGVAASGLRLWIRRRKLKSQYATTAPVHHW